MFPVIDIAGSPYGRGHAYGRAVTDRIRHSLASYAGVYRDEAGWDWAEAKREAGRYLPAIESFAPSYVEELAGIADGAGVERADVLAINIRTEVMNAARIRSASRAAAPSECTAFVAIAADAHVIAGQNWDWAPFALDTLVVLRCEPDEGPAYVTVVEAGLLAKFGGNSEGVAVMTNALICTEDVGEAGVPYHVLLRALLDCGSTQEGLDRLAGASRASSANYLLADRAGHLADVEARPGDGSAMHHLVPDASRCLLHTNHFVAADFPARDYTTMVESTSRTRLGQVTSMVSEGDARAGLASYAPALTDHTHSPDSVCRHVDPTEPLNEQSVTVAATLMDLTDPTMLVAEGPPCGRGFEMILTPW
jgi:isopenicillin-N N-acyltransferase-like protein